MGASILLFGDKEVQRALKPLIGDLASFTVETVADSQDAMSLVQAQQPDLLLIQMSSASLELCRQVKALKRWAWIYCFLLDVNPVSAPSAVEPDEANAAALEAGADAYLNLGVDEHHPMALQIQAQRRLVLAHIHAGLRQVDTHRELMRDNDVLTAIALADPLTDLHNRRAFDRDLPRQIQAARSRNQSLSLVMLDVDFFKAINDTYGHPVGDRALMLLAARLRHNLRFYDMPFRYGGEEFVIILNNTDHSEAVMIANRLCQLTREQSFKVGPTVTLTITISAGVATLEAADDEAGIRLLERADQRLLRAKANGRNQVVSD